FIPHYANVKFFQLDHFHLLRTRVSKKKVRLYNLTINPVFCSIEPPEDFSGLWVNYFITGMVSSATNYQNGLKHGIEIKYSHNGEKFLQREYGEGKIRKIYSFENGKLVEENITILLIEGESME